MQQQASSKNILLILIRIYCRYNSSSDFKMNFKRHTQELKSNSTTSDRLNRLTLVIFLSLGLVLTVSNPYAVASDMRTLQVEGICSPDIDNAIKASKVFLSQQLVTSVEAYTGSSTSVKIVGQAESVIQQMDYQTETHTSSYLLDYNYVITREYPNEVCIDASAKGDREKAIADIEWKKTIRDLPNIESLVKAREISKEEFYRHDRKPRRIE